MALSVPGRYQHIRDLAPGGMGHVAVYTDANLDRQVVIKSVAPGPNYRRAQDEVSALERLRSAYVVAIFDVIVDPQTREIGIVEEYLEGRDLSDIIDLAQVPDPLLLLYELAAALADVHGAGVVHRDIKPNNIRVLPNNRIVLFDFGLARDIEHGAQTAGFVGTIAYAAPELFATGHVEFDESVDIYAMGAVAYELLEGQALPPMIARASTTEWFSLQPLRNSQSLKHLFDRCLAVDRTDRPSAVELRDALKRELLRDKHRALLVGPSQTLRLSADARTARLTASGLGSITLYYDGYDFRVTSVDGAVTRNNATVVTGDIISGCSLFTFGNSGANRIFVPFDISNPEVTPQ